MTALLMLLLAGAASAQPIVSRAKLDSIANPALAANAQSVRFDRTTHHYGTRSEDEESLVCSFDWVNQSDKPVVITHVKTSCSCVVADYARQPIPAKGRSTIRVVYHPKGHPGYINRRIMVYTHLSATQPTAILTLSGSITPSADQSANFPYALGALRLKQNRVNFRSPAQYGVERILCLNHSDQPLRITAMQAMLPEGVTLRCEPETIAPHAEADLIVRIETDKVCPQGQPRQFPIILEGVDTPPSQRRITVHIEF